MTYWNGCKQNAEMRGNRPDPVKLLSAKEYLLMALVKLKLYLAKQYFFVLFASHFSYSFSNHPRECVKICSM